MSDAVSQLARLEAALSAAGDAAYDWNISSGEILWLAGATHVLDPADGIGGNSIQRLHDRIHPDDLKIRLDAVDSLRPDIATFDCEFRLRDTDGNHHWYHDRGLAHFDASGTVVRICGSLRPISEEKADREKVQYLANYDELTGHFNKTRLREALDQSLYYCSRYKVDGALFVVGIDIRGHVPLLFVAQTVEPLLAHSGHHLAGRVEGEHGQPLGP